VEIILRNHKKERKVKFARFKWQGKVQYGVVDGDDLLSVTGNIFDKYTVGSAICKLKDVKLLNPVEKPRNILNVGLNYGNKLQRTLVERGLQVPETPIIFVTAMSSVAENFNDDVVYPSWISDRVIHAAEPVVIIGKKAQRVPESEAKKYVFGYTVGEDMAAVNLGRVDLRETTSRAHNFDNFRHFGPFISTDVDGDNLELISKLNGKVMSRRNTSEMNFNVSIIISWITNAITMLPGDLVFMGNTISVPVKIGDVAESEIEGIGSIKFRMVAPK